MSNTKPTPAAGSEELREAIREQIEELALSLRSGSKKGRHVTAIVDVPELTAALADLFKAHLQAAEKQAFERGRIAEAKTCEEAKRHDSKLHESVGIGSVDGDLREVIENILDDFGHDVVNNPQGSRRSLQSKPIKQLEQLFTAHLQAAVREAEERGRSDGWDAAEDRLRRGQFIENDKNDQEPIIGMTVGDGVIPMTVAPVVAPKPKANQGEK